MKRSCCLLLLCVVFQSMAHAGGNNGAPQTWANGQIVYYTDQGSLSVLLPSSQADRFVADAWAEWTSVPLASLNVIHGGRLSVDVTGSNFASAADLLPGSGIPVAVVYDADGTVISALLGQGAGSPDLCSTNGVFGQVDTISEDGHIAHALIVINGNCALNAANLPVLHYQLVRELGRILGLDYSQLNENVVTGTPTPTASDYAGYPVMHPLGVICTYASGCMANAEVPRMDDRAALARLYPAPLFAATTARVYGRVRFPSWRGAIGQGMQGVNVVARLIDPTSGRVSTQYSASSVSGFLFRGNAGNPVTGYTTALGDRWDEHGSSDLSLEGFYDLSGLEIPQGYNSATYQISVEPMNALYSGSTSVGPYVAGQVTTKGTAVSVRVTIAAGAEVAQDFTMQGAASQPQDRWEPSSFTAPSPIPLQGSWTASLSGYGDRDYYLLPVQANRTLTFDVTAIDESGSPNVNKALPVLGLWSQGSSEDTPGLSQTYFNALPTATTRLQASINAAGNYKLGVMDYRGDGRPDFLYTAHLFYADQLSPAHVGVQGGSVVKIAGFGFTATTQVSVNGSPVATTYLAPNQMQFQTPALADGTYTVLVSDSATGATSQMTNALIVGAVNAKLILVNGANPQVPVGTVAPNPFSVQVVDSASSTPIAGATVFFSAPAAITLIGCVRNPCAVVSDQNGMAGVQMLALQPGASVVTATLATGGTPLQATVNGLASSLAISLAQQIVYVLSGATMSVPISAQVVSNGLPASGKPVNFLLNYGTATISPASAITSNNGTAVSQVSVSAISAAISLSACVAPTNSPCRTFIVEPVPISTLHLQAVSGGNQTISVGQSLAPVALRVTDASGDPISGAVVTFDVHVYRSTENDYSSTGEAVIFHPSETVALTSSSATRTSDSNGLVTLPGPALPSEPVRVQIRASVSTAQLNLQMNSDWPAPNSGSLPASPRSPLVYRPGLSRLRVPIRKQE